MMGMSLSVPNALVGNFPVFAEQGYQQWRREV